MNQRTKLIAGNWKMNLTSTEGSAMTASIIKQVEARWDVDVVVCPVFLSIPKMRDVLKQSPIKLGAQDVFWMEKGAFTGQISARQLFEFCVDFCIVGHSETRGRFGSSELPASTLSYFGETDETVNLKIKALLYFGINPILCVGETLEEREAGRTEEVIVNQLKAALDGVHPAEMYSFVVAYEPVWAIGTGKTCDAAEANRICGLIRSWVAENVEPEAADVMRVLYGGSVKASNAKELFSQPEIDGGLVGGASLIAEEFVQIVGAA
jgi:triosephosphate isomerase